MTSDSFLSVAEDLEYLRGHWKSGAATDELRRGSAILRRFLAEGVLQRAWLGNGFSRQPVVCGPDLIALAGGDPGIIELALAGGAMDKGVKIAGAVQTKGEKPPPPTLDKGKDLSSILEKSWTLREYVESPCVIVDGKVIKRRELIKYFANQLGGVHLSSKIRKKEEPMVKRLKKMEGRFSIMRKDGLYYEILSIGQTIGNSPDLLKLTEKIREYQEGEGS